LRQIGARENTARSRRRGDALEALSNKQTRVYGTLELTSAEPGAGLSVFEGSMPASWAFLFWFLDALVEDFILPGARHERLRPPDLTGLVSANGK
jgi:hypothetical protein